MLYFQVVILAATVMLAYYCEYTDTFTLTQQGFVCHDPSLTKPDPGPERDSRIPPIVLYSVVTGLPGLLISAIELVLFLLWYNSKDLDNEEKVVVMGDCCYLNPLVRRTFRFLGVYVFGLFATDIFVNAGQLVTGSLSPHFLSVCQPNYTALGCQEIVHFVSQSDACTGDTDDITRARKSFPSKEAALSLYAAIYLGMYVMCCAGSSGSHLARPLLCLSLVSLAVLTGINRVAEYRNHWSDVIAGQATGGAIAVFLVVFVVQYFKRGSSNGQTPSELGVANSDVAPPLIDNATEIIDKFIITQDDGHLSIKCNHDPPETRPHLELEPARRCGRQTVTRRERGSTGNIRRQLILKSPA
ncbi:phospholipid phosphatase-related protein type 5-like [Polymixia lowei]